MSISSLCKESVRRAISFLGYEINRIQKPQRLTKNQQLLSDRLDSPPVKLHIGCGPRVLKGWINVDLRYEHFGKYVRYYTDAHFPAELRGELSDFFEFDLTKMAFPLPSNSVDVIFHEDFLEHLNQRDQILFLAETLRLLKPGAIHRVNTPDLLCSMCQHSNFLKGYEGVYVAEWNKHGHLNVLSPRMLEEMALMCGYSRVNFTARNQSHSTLIPLEYRPDPNDRPDDGNIFADLFK